MQRIRNHPRIFIVGALLLALVGLMALTAAGVLAQSAAPSAGYSLTWDVLANGGTTMSSAHFRMQSTAGQPLTAVSTSGDLRLKSGYWYGLQDVLRRVFLPLLDRNH
jgi:hypothetical protein